MRCQSPCQTELSFTDLLVELVIPPKAVLFLVDMFHKDLGEVRKLCQQKCQFSSLKGTKPEANLYLMSLDPV